MFTEDLSLMFAPGMLGIEPVRINGVDTHAMVDRDTQLDGVMLVGEISLLLPTSRAPAAAAGQPVLVGGVAHRIRQVLGEPPDAALRRLILAKG